MASASASSRPRVTRSSFTWPTSGIMILAMGLPPARRTATWALRMARVWIFTKSGIMMPRRQPRRPSMGFCSCIDLMVASSSRVLGADAASPARVTLTSCSSRLGRNSWSGGSMRRMTTGRPSMALKMPSKSPCWRRLELGHGGVEGGDGLGLVSGEVLARAALALARVATLATRMAPRTISRRSPSRNMCSVRQRPMPSAP